MGRDWGAAAAGAEGYAFVQEERLHRLVPA